MIDQARPEVEVLVDAAAVEEAALEDDVIDEPDDRPQPATAHVTAIKPASADRGRWRPTTRV